MLYVLFVFVFFVVFIILCLIVYRCHKRCDPKSLAKRTNIQERYVNSVDYDWKYYYSRPDDPEKVVVDEGVSWNELPCYNDSNKSTIYREQIKKPGSSNELGPERIPDLTNSMERKRCCDPSNPNDYAIVYEDPTMNENLWNNNSFCGTKTRYKQKKNQSCHGDDIIDRGQKTNGNCCGSFDNIDSQYTVGSYDGEAVPIDESEFQNPSRTDYCEQTYFKKKTRKACKTTTGDDGDTEQLLGSSTNQISCCNPNNWSSIYGYCVKRGEDAPIYCKNGDTPLFKKERNECGDVRWSTPCERLKDCGENEHSGCENVDTSSCVNGKYLGTITYKNYTEYAPPTNESKPCEARDCDSTCITDKNINDVPYGECDNKCGGGWKYKSVNLQPTSYRPTNKACRNITGDPHVYIKENKLYRKQTCYEDRECDCELAAYKVSNWTDCNTTDCGNGMKQRTIYINRFPGQDGKNCDHNDVLSAANVDVQSNDTYVLDRRNRVLVQKRTFPESVNIKKVEAQRTGSWVNIKITIKMNNNYHYVNPTFTLLINNRSMTMDLVNNNHLRTYRFISYDDLPNGNHKFQLVKSFRTPSVITAWTDGTLTIPS